MGYRPIFDPEHGALRVPPRPPGDRFREDVYLFDDELTLAVNVALATGRPLLIRGAPGTGKSSVAPAVAKRLGWPLHREVVTSRTTAQDLLWQFDAVSRLRDAYSGGALEPAKYVRPGVLWKAFDPQSAAEHTSEPLATGGARAVVLLDEIDKADPDVPNNLLVALGSRRFTVRELDLEVRGEHVPLVFITTNEERALPDAFVRRCVTIRLQVPQEERMLAIGRSHFDDDASDALLRAVYARLSDLLEAAGARLARPPSTAEFLDAVRACVELGVAPEDDLWMSITAATLEKAEAP